MFKFQKKIVNDYLVNYIHVNFMRHKRLNTLRGDEAECFMCNKAFEAEDMVHLAYVSNRENVIICESCKDLALANGAEETTYNKK